jgi:Ig-like domain CHU_C associated
MKNKIYAIAIVLLFCCAKLNAQCTTPVTPPSVTNLVIYTGSKTLSQLNVPGTNVQFYNAASGGTALSGTTSVQDDSTYYVSQTISGCESSRKQIVVNRIANDSIVLCNPATVAGLTATPQSGNATAWFNTATGGTALMASATLATGTNTLYAEEVRSGTDTITRIPGSLFGANFNTITVLARGENDTIYFGTYKGDIYRANPDGSDTVKIKPGTQQINWLEFRKEGAARYLYYTLYAGNDIKKYNLATGAVTTLGSGFFGVRQICFDDANNRIFIADAENYKIKMLNTATNAITVVDSFPGVFPTSILRPFAVYYHAGLNKLFFNNFDQGKLYSKDLSSLTNPKVEIATISSLSSISLLPNGKFLIAAGDRIYTLNTDGTGQTTLYSSLYNTVNPFYNNNNLLTYNTHTKVVREAAIQSNRVPVTVIVNPTPNVTATTDKVVCNGSTVAAISFSTTTTGGTVTYSWTNNNASIGLATSGTGNIPSFTAANNGTAPDTASIIVTPTITNEGVNCVGVKDTFYIIVNPTATVAPITNQAVCNASSTAVVNFGSPTTGGSIVYNWTNKTTSIGLAASGTGNIASFNAVNTGTAPVVDTITVTPSFTNAGVTCTGTPRIFTITVNPSAVVNAIAGQTLCAAQPTTAVNFTGPLAGTTYNWVNTNSSIGLAASGSGNIPSFTTQNNTLSTISGKITVTPNTAAGCVGTSKSFDYVVQALSIAPTGISTSISGAALLVCDTNRTVTLSVVGGGLGTGAVWKWYKDACGGTSIGTGSTLTNIDVTQTTTFYVRAEGTCNITSCASVTIQVGKLITHVRQHWNDVLFFDNASKNFVSWQWYKNGVIVPGATLQYYSENGASLNGQYYCMATDKNGNRFITCPINCTAGGFRGVELAGMPNPVMRSQQFKLKSSLIAAELQGATITVTNVFGTVVTQSAATSTITTMQAPAAGGVYIVTLVLRNGQRYTTTLLVN